MKFKTLKGKIRAVKTPDYAIEWDNPKTSLSKFQFAVKQFLKSFWHKKICCEELPMAGSKNRFDLVNMTDKIVVECDGEGHSDPSYYLHSSPLDYLKQLQRDAAKNEWCKLNGFTMCRVLPEDLPLTQEAFEKRHGVILRSKVK